MPSSPGCFQMSCFLQPRVQNPVIFNLQSDRGKAANLDISEVEVYHFWLIFDINNNIVFGEFESL